MELLPPLPGAFFGQQSDLAKNSIFGDRVRSLLNYLCISSFYTLIFNYSFSLERSIIDILMAGYGQLISGMHQCMNDIKRLFVYVCVGDCVCGVCVCALACKCCALVQASKNGKGSFTQCILVHMSKGM